MNILLISQCNKNALKETRRVLDQFAERKGERTWQTGITLQGLDTLRRMLRKRARKNTAVACHWIRGKDHTELLWIVGDAARFNAQGAVPTNTTSRDILRREDENDWHSAEDIRLLAALAALLHDLGKSNATFQKKLKSRKPQADPFRHEWISLRLFQAFVGDDDDRGWLLRLAELPDQPDLGWMDSIPDDAPERTPRSPFKRLPPLARAVGWLIVSHHRMPANRPAKREEVSPKSLNRLPGGIVAPWCGSRLDLEQELINGCRRFNQGLPFQSAAWRERVRRFAKRILERDRLLAGEALLDNTFLLHTARLLLMLADHHYSSLEGDARTKSGDPSYPLLANTTRTGAPNQPLDEHLIGVETATGRLAHLLPRLERDLPRIARHKGFKRRSANPRFKWQDKAFDLAGGLREKARADGFFGINMASTGRGKTLANGRILYALADPVRGARFTMALGLRTLTLQTGSVYRDRLGLGPDDLAVLVGGGAVKRLHERNQEPAPEESRGQESAEALLPENSYVHFEGALGETLLGGWLAKTRGASALVQAPILCCTIDHLMPATEGVRGGRQIAPMLRLLSSDLVLDEPDDFGLEDLPALSRLVHWAGLLGSRVLLSSATLPPALVEALFDAYRGGRAIFQANRGEPGRPLNICTAWFDEFRADAGNHGEIGGFMEQHRAWVEKRVHRLRGGAPEIRQRAAIKPFSGTPGPDLPVQAAEQIRASIEELHAAHGNPDPATGVRVSFGLVRLANIDPLIDITRALMETPPRSGLRLHLCCYHSRHPLLVRSNLERRLDRLLQRHDEEAVFHDPEIRAILSRHPQDDHIFLVLATPVAEVGRDHDYDWAVVEPSSMRSIIQLAGRVRRHRKGACPAEQPNIHLLQTNLKALGGRAKAAYCRPGFEEADHFLLETHDLAQLLTEDQLAVIDAAPRILERPDPQPGRNLADLEQAHLRAVLLGDARGSKAPASRWWTTRAPLSGELQRVSPFRYDPQGRVRFAFLLDEDTDGVNFCRLEDDGCFTERDKLLEWAQWHPAEGADIWMEMDYAAQLLEIAQETDRPPDTCGRDFGYVDLPLQDEDRGWTYHPALGFRRKL